MTKISLKLKTAKPICSKQVMGNCKKANCPEFSKKVDDLVRDIDDSYSPYMIVTKLCDAIKKSAKSAIPRGKCTSISPFGPKN